MGCIACSEQESPTSQNKRPTPKSDAPSVLLITMDTTRADRLGCYGYESAKTPNLDALAKGGVLFTRAYCQTPMTLPSHASILTGLYPMHHGIRLNGPYRLPESVPTIAEILQTQGWATGAFVSAVVLDSQYGLDKGFDVYEDNITREQPGRSERRAEETVGLALDWLKTIPKDKPWFAWVHVFDPHFPYEPPEPYKTEFADSPYDGEIAYMDEMIGRLIAGARAAAPEDQLMIIATADHGEGLGEHGEKTHSLFVFDSTIRVPMIVEFPIKLSKGKGYQQGTSENSLVESVDIATTILSETGHGAMSGSDGSLMELQIGGYNVINDVQKLTPNSEENLRAAYAETYYPLSFGWSPIWSARKRGVKFLLDSKPELYVDDPSEATNRIEQEASKANEMRAHIEDLLDSSIAFESNTSSPTDTEQLRDLGYLGSALQEASLEDLLALPDPADRIADFDAINAARAMAKAGHPGEAVAMLEPILKRDPNNPVLLQVLGSTYIDLNRIDEAVTTLAKYHDLAPDDLESAVYLGNAWLRQGKPAEAESVLRMCVTKLPTYAEAWDQLGVALGMQKKFKEATEAGQRAHELSPSNTNYHVHFAVSLLNSGRADEAEKRLAALAERFPERKDIAGNLETARRMKLAK